MTNDKSIAKVGTFPTNLGTEPGQELVVGQFYWCQDHDDEEPWLGCIVSVGSNFAEMEGVGRWERTHWRVHFENFEERCKPEPNPDAVIKMHLGTHQKRVNELLNEIKQLSAQLGVIPPELEAQNPETPAQALAVAHGMADVHAHKKALIKFKEKTLPDLFKQVEKEHELVAAWMKAQLVPMEAEAKILKRKTKAVEDRIFTVELYAGLVEKLKKIKDGKPATNGDKVFLFQRRHYMDEECLVDYQAGGMEFKSLEAFDRWLLKKKNLHRILPHPRCVVAFQVRRKEKKREFTGIESFIRFLLNREAEADKKTFLYIRNGEQVYRLATEIEFGEQLFPDQENTELLGGGNLWIKGDSFGRVEVLSQREYDSMLERRKQAMDKYANAMVEWKKKPKKDRGQEPRPHWFDTLRDIERYEPCTRDSVHYDDAMRQIARMAMDHNRVAVVLQGLLDRSPVFHPHPPWQLFTLEGFRCGIELVYDMTRGLTSGDPPDFEAYRAKLNAEIKKGSMTVGQEDLWEQMEADKDYERNKWRPGYRDSYRYRRHRPYGNPGPGLVAEVKHLSRDKGRCTFEWLRERLRASWRHDSDSLTARFSCETSKLLNVSAYTPGDFHIFYDDPRTRENYLEWAPLLLAAEDWYGKAESRGTNDTPDEEPEDEDYDGE